MLLAERAREPAGMHTARVGHFCETDALTEPRMNDLLGRAKPGGGHSIRPARAAARLASCGGHQQFHCQPLEHHRRERVRVSAFRGHSPCHTIDLPRPDVVHVRQESGERTVIRRKAHVGLQYEDVGAAVADAVAVFRVVRLDDERTRRALKGGAPREPQVEGTAQHDRDAGAVVHMRSDVAAGGEASTCDAKQRRLERDRGVAAF